MTCTAGWIWSVVSGFNMIIIFIILLRLIIPLGAHGCAGKVDDNTEASKAALLERAKVAEAKVVELEQKLKTANQRIGLLAKQNLAQKKNL